MILKVTLKQQLYLLLPMVLRYAILFSLFVYLFGTDILELPYWILYAIFCLDGLPAIILHVQYLLQNKDTIITIDTDKQLLYCKYSQQTTTIAFADIKELVYHVSYGRNTGWYSFERYRYYTLIDKKSQRIVITCLLMNKIEEKLEQMVNHQAEKRLSIFAFISKNNFTYLHLAANKQLLQKQGVHSTFKQ